MKNKQKGITLIALIITIIVMLILVSVTITVAVNNGLFKAAQSAAKNTQSAVEFENALAGGQITVKVNGENQVFASIDDYIASINGPQAPTYKYNITVGGVDTGIGFNDEDTIRNGPDAITYEEIQNSYNGTYYVLLNGTKTYYVDPGGGYGYGDGFMGYDDWCWSIDTTIKSICSGNHYLGWEGNLISYIEN